MNTFSLLRKTLVGCLVLVATATANAQFKGGVDDGTHVGQTSNQPLGRNIFLGGTDDGTSLGVAANQPFGRNIFLGGTDDGTSLGLAANQPFGRNIFVGGVDDGTSVGVAANQPFGRNIFVGGIDDGTSLGVAANQPFGRNIFLGGGNDGWALAFKTAGNTPLPVTLTEFSGRWQQQDALLFWATATEVNSAYFELERSFDGKAFTRVQQIAAAGQSTSIRNYQYVDAAVSKLLPADAANVYYRLRSVDKDGTAAYSGIVVLKGTSGSGNPSTGIEYAVFPNPARDFVTISISQFPAAGEAYIRLLDVSGRVLLVQKMTSSPQQLSVSAFAGGLYFLQLVAAEKVVYTQRIIISK